MIVQNDYYADLATRVIIPLMRPQQLPRWHQHAVPRINIEFDSFLLCTPMSSNLNNPATGFRLQSESCAPGRYRFNRYTYHELLTAGNPLRHLRSGFRAVKAYFIPSRLSFIASRRSTSRYQRGWCFFAQRRLTLPSIIPLIDPFTQNAIYIWIRMAWIRMMADVA